MTTVTEAVRRRPSRLESSPHTFAELCADSELAAAFVEELIAHASELNPGHAWSAEQLAILIRRAKDAAPRNVRQLREGRDLRRHVRIAVDRCHHEDRPFAVAVFVLRGDLHARFEAALPLVTSSIRETDFVFQFRTRFAVIIDSTSGLALTPAVTRLLAAVESTLGLDAVTRTSMRSFANQPQHELEHSAGELHTVLDWVEDQLR